MMNIQSTITLNNGVEIPQFGLGVYQTKEGPEVETAVRAALDFGYRHIDTAALYGNEVGTGNAIRASGISREEIFVTTKVWNSALREGKVREAFETSMSKLDIGYIDLYLVHWPVPGEYVNGWLELEKLYAEGKIRSIGVSNYNSHHFEDVLDAGDIVPAVNQVELHPRLRQLELHHYLKEKGCAIEAWSPLMRAQIFDESIPDLDTMAEAHGKTVAQVILRWHLQHGIVVIPKSTRPSRIEENGSIFDFELSGEEMARIDALDRHQRIGPDPDNFGF